jgi:hypothetical protein
MLDIQEGVDPMYIGECAAFNEFYKSSRLRLLNIARCEFQRYSRLGQRPPYKNHKDLAEDVIRMHRAFLNDRLLDLPHDKIYILFQNLVRIICRRDDTHYHANPTAVTIVRPVVGNFFQLRDHSAPSLGARLITYAKDRLLSVKAKFDFDRFACQKVGLARARLLIASQLGV